jgi:hypothetical protein
VTQVAPPSLVAANAVAMPGSPIWLLIAAQLPGATVSGPPPLTDWLFSSVIS